MHNRHKYKGLYRDRGINADIINQFIEKYGLYILLSLTAIIVFIVFHDFIIFKKLYLFKGLASDSVNDTYPNYILISDYLRTDGIPKWSFRQGMGQNIFPFSFPDPFVSFLYLLGRKYLAYGIAYMEILKIFLAGVLFYLFLKKRSLSSIVCIIGGLMYSFSGFMIVGSSWNLFSTEVVYLAFLLLAFEKLYQENNWLLFPVAVALISILQPFDLWLFGLFLLIYILVRHFEENEKSYKKLFNILFHTGLLACLGVGIGSFFFLSEVRMMLNSPRVGGSSGYFSKLLSQSPLLFESGLHYVTAVMRLFSSELLGNSNNYMGWYNYMEAPLFYCGLINLLLVPQLFQFLDKRRKQIYAVSLIVVFLPSIFPILRYSLWLFTGNYYRIYSLFVAIVLMFFSLQALYYIFKQCKVNRKLLIITLIMLLIVLYYPYELSTRYGILNSNLRNLITLFLFSYTVLLFLLNARNYFPIQLLLILLICIELASFSGFNVNERKAITNTEHKRHMGYWDYTNEAITFINNMDKGFFRIAKNYSSGPAVDASLNDSKIQRYRGTASYHSFNHRHYVEFLAGMNMIDEKVEAQTRWLNGFRNTPLLHSFASVKYYLVRHPDRFTNLNYDSLTTIHNFIIYRNKFVLPLGFSYNCYIRRSDFNSLPPFQKGVALYNAFVLNGTIYPDYLNVFPPYKAESNSNIYHFRDYFEDIKDRRNDTLAISKFGENYIKGAIDLDEKKMLFLSIPYSNGWSALVDGKKQKLLRINIGFTGLLLDKGHHNIELSYIPPMFYPGAIISGVSILLFALLVILNKRRKGIQNTPL